MKVGVVDETREEEDCVRGRLFHRHLDDGLILFLEMSKQYQSKKKRRFNQADETIDDEQVEKTLNFFDAIIDQYLNDENVSINFQGYIYPINIF
jgi:hypothetical protein